MGEELLNKACQCIITTHVVHWFVLAIIAIGVILLTHGAPHYDSHDCMYNSEQQFHKLESRGHIMACLQRGQTLMFRLCLFNHQGIAFPMG